VQHQGSQSEFLHELLRKAGQQARLVAAHTIGTALIMAGSFVARSVVGPLPGGEQVSPSAPPPANSPRTGTAAASTPGSDPNVKHAA
jgi:hypothetical protein